MKRRQKILYLSQAYPYPADGGGRIKTLSTLLALCQKYDVHAVFVAENQPSKKDRLFLETKGITVTVFYNPHLLDSVKDDLWGLTKNFLRGRPHYLFQYTLAEAFPFVATLIAEWKPDIIHVDHLNLAQYLPHDKDKNQTWILEHHNLEFYLYWTRFVNSQRLPRKIYLGIELLLTFWYEWRNLQRFDHIFAISDEERNRIKRIFKLNRITTQPLIYPLAKYKKTVSKHPYILFIGNLGWPPNEDAVEWFLQKIWPQVKAELPAAQFHVVGKRHLPAEKNFKLTTNVFLHGYQKDLSRYLAKATVFVLPFRMGGGVRIKSLTALAHQIPLVSTDLGVEGLKVTQGQEYVGSNQPITFSRHLITLLQDGARRAQMSKKQATYMTKFHDLNQNQVFLKQYAEVTQ